MTKSIQSLRVQPDDISELSERVRRLEETVPGDKLCICVFSGDLDRQIAALIIATGAASSGMEVQLFFTFWATASLRDPHKRAKKSLMGRMFGWMLPQGSRELKLSKLQMMGMGPLMIRRLMEKKGVPSLEDLFVISGELGVKIRICTMSMDLMEFKAEEFVDYPDLGYCGVASFVEETSAARTTLFI